MLDVLVAQGEDALFEEPLFAVGICKAAHAGRLQGLAPEAQGYFLEVYLDHSRVCFSGLK